VTIELCMEVTRVVIVRVIACVCVILRQSYDVTIELCVEGTGIRSANTLDMKNAHFRYWILWGVSTLMENEVYQQD
jgi:hypothetical protein